MKTALLLAFACTAAAADGPGDATRGAAIVASRSEGLCVLCHAVPGVPGPLQGTLAPPLAGAGARWDAATLRRRLLEPERFNPETIMPSYGRTEGLVRVAAERSGKPLLTPAQVDDVVAYLATLK
jgi:sulfur-oxidizing protein SoxX